MSDQLKKILESMVVQANNSDYEEAHGEADALLTELIDTLSKKIAVADRKIVAQILHEYEKVGKWYA